MNNKTSITVKDIVKYLYLIAMGTDKTIIRSKNATTISLDFFAPIIMGKVLQPQALSPSISEMSRLNSLGIIIKNGKAAYKYIKTTIFSLFNLSIQSFAKKKSTRGINEVSNAIRTLPIKGDLLK